MSLAGGIPEPSGYPTAWHPCRAHINFLVFVTKLEVLDQRVLVQGFQEDKVLHPHGAFQERHVKRVEDPRCKHGKLLLLA